MEKERIRSTKAQLSRFRNSFIWKDIVTELNEWKEGFEKANENLVRNTIEENLTSASVLLIMGEVSGITKAIERMIIIPDVLLSILGGIEEEEEDD